MDDMTNAPGTGPAAPAQPAPAMAPSAEAPAAPIAPPRKRRGAWFWLGLVVALAVLAAIGWFGYRGATARNRAVADLAEATTRLEAADAVVVQIDEVVRAQVDEATGAKARDANDKLPQAKTDLAAALDLIDTARPDLPDNQLTRADALKASSEARVAMLEQAGPILEANISAAEALTPATEGWTLLSDAEKLADQAVVEYNKLSKDSVAKSQTLTTQAETKLKDARTKFDTADKAFPDAKLVVYVNYIDEKLALLALSKKADVAFTSGNNAQANEYSNQYNAKDKQVVELAKKLPASPSKAIADAYDKAAGDATTAYFKARDAATKADQELRGIEG